MVKGPKWRRLADLCRRRVVHSRQAMTIAAAMVVGLILWVYCCLWTASYLGLLELDKSSEAAQRLSRVWALQYSLKNESVAHLRSSASRRAASRLEDDVAAELQRIRSATENHRRPALENKTRIRFVTVTDQTGIAFCIGQLSAAVYGCETAVLGIDQSYSHVNRYERVMDFIKAEGLSDEDVVVLLDSDVVWTGESPVSILASFVDLSPSSFSDLRIAAVRAWEDYGVTLGRQFLEELNHLHEPSAALEVQMPPILFNAEVYCSWSQTTEGYVGCHVANRLMDYELERARNGYSTTDPEGIERYAVDREKSIVSQLLRGTAATRFPQRRRDPQDTLFFHSNMGGKDNPMRYLNAGGAVARVWALRQYLDSFNAYTDLEHPTTEKERHWVCDQSIHGAIYTQTRVWEATQGLLVTPYSTGPVPAASGPHKIVPGLTGIDRRSELFFTIAGVLGLDPENFVHTKYHERYMEVQNGLPCPLEAPDCPTSFSSPRTTPAGFALTPPLLRRRPCRQDANRGLSAVEDADPDTVYAPLVHIPGSRKAEKYVRMIPLMPWRAAASLNQTACAAVKGKWRTTTLDVWSSRVRYLMSLATLCPDVMKSIECRGAQT